MFTQKKFISRIWYAKFPHFFPFSNFLLITKSHSTEEMWRWWSVRTAIKLNLKSESVSNVMVRWLWNVKALCSCTFSLYLVVYHYLEMVLPLAFPKLVHISTMLIFLKANNFESLKIGRWGQINNLESFVLHGLGFLYYLFACSPTFLIKIKWKRVFSYLSC